MDKSMPFYEAYKRIQRRKRRLQTTVIIAGIAIWALLMVVCYFYFSLT